MKIRTVLGGVFVLAACTLEPVDEPAWVTAACEEHEFVIGDRDHDGLVYDCAAVKWVSAGEWEQGE